MKLKYFVLTLFALVLALPTLAVTVNLKITYNGAGVANSDITIKHGDVALGSGRTDSDGKVSISASNLISRSIDVYGRKTCGSAVKTWDVKGWVTLDDNNFAHLKMEDVVKEMSGMGMPESMLVSAWGLSASGCNDAPSGGTNSTADASADKNTGNSQSDAGGNDTSESDDDGSMEAVDWDQMREDNLKMRRTGLENEITMHSNRISRKAPKVDKMKRDGEDPTEIRRAEIDLETEKLKKEKKELDLEQVVAKLDGPALSASRRSAIDQRITAIKVELGRLKDEDKTLKEQGKEAKKEEKFEDMGKLELKKNLADLKMKRSSKKTKLKLAGKTMSKSNRTEMEAEIVELDREIEKYEQRIQELKGEGDDDETGEEEVQEPDETEE